jgi:bifunctional non-homologous end joining protein LigD
MPTLHPRHLERDEAQVAGVHITHPHRAVFPSLGITKEKLARYYEDIAPWMLPYVRGRPLTLVRAPSGAEAPVAVTRHAHAFRTEAVGRLRRVCVREKTKTDDYLVADSADALVALAQLDVLEVHTWNARADRLEAPDRVVFDLDPGPGVAWDSVVDLALRLRDLLMRLELESFVKTTGGRGLHVVVPLAPRAGWDECLAFSRAVATRMAQADPRHLTSSMVRSARVGRIYIDYLRNHRTASCIAEYSTRALGSAPVAVPLAWDEVSPGTRSDAYTMQTVLRRLKDRLRDPWPGYGETKQRLRAATMRELDSMALPRRS